MDMFFVFIIASNLCLTIMDAFHLDPPRDPKNYKAKRMEMMGSVLGLGFGALLFINGNSVIQSLEATIGTMDIWKWLVITFVTIVAAQLAKFIVNTFVEVYVGA